LGLQEVRALGDVEVAVRDVVLGADLAGAGVELAAHEERHQVLDDAGERHLAVHQVVLVGTVGVALGVRVVLVDEDALLRRRDGLGPGAGQVQDTLARLVPEHAIPRIGRLRGGVLRVRVVHVEARPVGQDQVDEARLLLGRDLLVLHVLEAAGVAQRALRLVVPSDPGRPVGLVRVDEQQRGEDRIEVGLVLDRDTVLGLDSHHFLNRHDAPGSPFALRGEKTRTAGERPALPPAVVPYRYWPVLMTRSTARCLSLISPMSGFTYTIRSPFLPAILAQSSGLVVLGRSSFSLNSSRTAASRSSTLMPFSPVWM